jgi:FkbM family methyltransferase
MHAQQRTHAPLNFSGIPGQSAIGKLLRLPLKLIPPEAQLLILQGPLRGKRWIAGAGNHGCWLGSYEVEKQKRFIEAITPGQCVLDIGAHVGFYTLLSAVLTGPTGSVFAIEPLPRNLHYLRRHLMLNRITNVSVIEATISDTTGLARFAVDERSTQGRLSFSGEMEVRVASLDALMAQGSISEPQIIKIDVEGGELDVLKGARVLLRDVRPTIFLATHSSRLHRDCCDLLRSLGYQQETLVEPATHPDELGEIIATPV